MKETKHLSLSERGFVVNPYYEKLLAMRRTDVRAFASISPASKLALFEYEKQKRQAGQDREGSP